MDATRDENARLRAEVEALKLQGAAAELVHRETATTVLVQMAEVEALRADANALFGALARLHYAPWKLDSTDAEYREWSQAMHEASAAIQRHRDAARAAQGDKT